MQRPGKHQVTETLFRIDPRSRDRVLYPNTNEYRVEFGKTLKNVVGISVHDARLPLTESTITTQNNIVSYVISGQTKQVSIDPGTYTETTLVDALNTVMNPDILVTYHPVPRRILFQSGQAGTPFQFDVTNTSMSRVLGFVHEDGFTPSATSYSPLGSVDLRGCSYVLIRSNDIKTPGTGLHTDAGLATLDIDSSSKTTSPIQRPYPVIYFDTIREKMNGLHIRIERDDGRLYDTGYTNHYILVRIFTLNERLIQMSNRHS